MRDASLAEGYRSVSGSGSVRPALGAVPERGEVVREFSVPAQVAIADSANLTETLFSRAAEEPDRTVFRRKEGTGWRDVGAREVADEVTRVAEGLVAAGDGAERLGAAMSS